MAYSRGGRGEEPWVPMVVTWMEQHGPVCMHHLVDVAAAGWCTVCAMGGGWHGMVAERGAWHCSEEAAKWMCACACTMPVCVCVGCGDGVAWWRCWCCCGAGMVRLMVWYGLEMGGCSARCWVLVMVMGDLWCQWVDPGLHGICAWLVGVVVAMWCALMGWGQWGGCVCAVLVAWTRTWAGMWCWGVAQAWAHGCGLCRRWEGGCK